MPTVNIPGVGAVEKKYVYVGAAGIAGFAGFMYWRNRQSAASTTDPSVSPDASVDPGAGTFFPDVSATDFGGSVPVFQSPINQTIPVTSDQQITTDAAWDSEAVAAAGDMGVDSGALSAALGRFLAGLCVSTAEADYVRRAEGMFGRPPQSPNLTVKVCPTDPGTPPPATGSATAPGGFRIVSTDKSGVTLGWNGVTGATLYLLHIDGNSLNHSVSTPHTSYRIGALKSKKTYHLNVRSVVGGATSPPSGTLSAKTK